MEELKEKLKELKEVLDKQESRNQHLLASVFLLANYYIVFHGAILAVVSNTISLTCSDTWFVILLSSIAAFLNMSALYSISMEYVRAKSAYDESLDDLDRLSQKKSWMERTPEAYKEPEAYRKDSCVEFRRRAVMVGCLILFVVFTVVTLVGAWVIICKHDNTRRHNNELVFKNNTSDSCVEFCSGSKCMSLCQTTR